MWPEDEFPRDEPPPIDGKYVMLVVEIDESGKAKLKLKGKVPVLGQSGTIGVSKKGGKYTLVCGLDKYDINEKDMPSPIRDLIDGSGKKGHSSLVSLPPTSRLVRNHLPIPYGEYASDFRSRNNPNEKPLPKPLYTSLTLLYLELLGAPLYL